MTTIEHKGLTFRVAHEHDTDHGHPWDESDCHGPVREVKANFTGYMTKRPGERILTEHFNRYGWVYDIAGALRIAERDGWGLTDECLAKLTARLGRTPTAREVRAEAVELDYDNLRRYLNDQWCYVGVVVTLLDVEGNDTHLSESLWGIESDSGDYLDEVAQDLAAQIAHDIPEDDTTVSSATRGRATVYTIRELEAA